MSCVETLTFFLLCGETFTFFFCTFFLLHLFCYAVKPSFSLVKPSFWCAANPTFICHSPVVLACSSTLNPQPSPLNPHPSPLDPRPCARCCCTRTRCSRCRRPRTTRPRSFRGSGRSCSTRRCRWSIWLGNTNTRWTRWPRSFPWLLRGTRTCEGSWLQWRTPSRARRGETATRARASGTSRARTGACRSTLPLQPTSSTSWATRAPGCSTRARSSGTSAPSSRIRSAPRTARSRPS
mmetsp:Transcript_9114/g.22593  ORF Transcript_9114/g.22593 Transcript_9114/m.22593 type:complete len:237 (+) Transcript_9114:52-762(+)